MGKQSRAAPTRGGCVHGVDVKETQLLDAECSAFSYKYSLPYMKLGSSMNCLAWRHAENIFT